MRKIFSFVFVWRWTFVLFILAASFWTGVYFITGNAPAVQYVFIEHYWADNVYFTNISLYKIFLLDGIFPEFVPFVNCKEILVAQLPFILPRWCDVLLIPVFLPLLCFIFKKEYYEPKETIRIYEELYNEYIFTKNDPWSKDKPTMNIMKEDIPFLEVCAYRYFIYIATAAVSLIFIVISAVCYPPQNADLGTYDASFMSIVIPTLLYIMCGGVGGCLNGRVLGFYFSRVKPAQELLMSLFFVFGLSMLLAGLLQGIVQGFLTATIITISHFYCCVLWLIVIFIFLSIKKVFISILNTSPVPALRRWLGIN